MTAFSDLVASAQTKAAADADYAAKKICISITEDGVTYQAEPDPYSSTVTLHKVMPNGTVDECLHLPSTVGTKIMASMIACGVVTSEDIAAAVAALGAPGGG